MADQLAATSSPTHTANALKKRPRMKEGLIQGFLFFCGALSILTTVGIVYELSKESLSFFTRQLWEDTNAQLVLSVDVAQTSFPISEQGVTLLEGDVIRLSDEVMRVAKVFGDTITVERGWQDTIPSTHSGGSEVFRSNRVSVIEFFTGNDWNPQIGRFGVWSLVTSTLLTSAIAMLVALPLGLSVAIYLSEYASRRARSVLKPILEVLAGIPTVVYGYFALTFMTPLLRSLFGIETVAI